MFDPLFEESNGQAIVYQGQTLVRYDRLEVEPGQELIVEFEKKDSEWKQGVALSIEGSFVVEGNDISSGKLLLWEHTAPEDVSVIPRIDSSREIIIKNVWDTGNGRVDSWYNGAAMRIESIESGRRYWCNDGYPDDDLDDLVFCIHYK